MRRAIAARSEGQAVATTANKTVRFARVVTRSGRPQVHTQWLSLEKDPELKRALAAHRVMAIDSVRGKTDVGHVATGSLPKGGGRYLVFPKSLKTFERARVVGIKFDLVEQGELVPAKKTTHAVRKRKAAGNAQLRCAAAAVAKREKAERRAEERAGIEKTRANALRGRPPREANAMADGLLRREVRAALRLLKAGKTVAAYQRLELALAAPASGEPKE